MNTEEELYMLRQENDKLRAFIANSPLNCIYCGLPQEDMIKCKHGFPGCARVDDMLSEKS